MERNKDDVYCLALFDTIFLFAMPLFVFISGLFSKKEATSKIFWQKQLNILIPLIVVTIPLALNDLRHGYSLWAVLRPGYTLWYLLALFWWRCAIQFTPDKILDKASVVITISCILSILSSFIPWGEHIALRRTLFFLPYFVCGYLCRGKTEIIMGFAHKLPQALSILILIISFVACFFIHKDLTFAFTGNTVYSTLESPVYLSFFARFLTTIAGIITSICILSLCPQGDVKIISTEGRNCLFYYVLHPFFIKALPLFLIIAKVPYSFELLIGYFVIIVTVIFFMRKIPYSNLIINPIRRKS